MSNREEPVMLKIRRVAAVSLAGLILCASSLYGADVANAATWSKTNTRVIYLVGTSGDPEASEYQDAYQWIYRSLSHEKRLDILRSRQVVLNYNSDSVLPATGGANPKPRVIQSENPPVPVGAGSECPGGNALLLDSWLHAYRAAWRIKEYLGAGDIRAILIGHSQGGMIARIIQLVAAGKIPTEAETGVEAIPSSCWPDLTDKIVGIVTVGAPLSSTCQGFPDVFAHARAWLTTNRLFNAGKVLVIGGDPKEIAKIFVLTGFIPLGCATNVLADSTRSAIYSFAVPNKIKELKIVAMEKEEVDACITSEKGGQVTLTEVATLQVGDELKISKSSIKKWNGTYKVHFIVGTSAKVYQFCKQAQPKKSTDGFVNVDHFQDHTWYIEGAGACPAHIQRITPGDGNVLQNWCGYKNAINSGKFPSSWSVIQSKEVAGQPGTIYDLIAEVVNGW